MADSKELIEAEPELVEEPASGDFIEYLGEQPHGTAFLTSHTLPRGEALWKRNGVEVKKDLTWERDPLGPPVGQKGNRMLLPVQDLPEGVAEVLEKTPGYKRVSE